MKFLCPSCESLAEVAAVRAEGTRVVFSCGLCGAETAQDALAPPVAARRTQSGGASSGEGMASPASRPRTISGERPAAGARVLALRKPPALDPETAHDPLFVPSAHCPKCLAKRRATVTACSQCGLLFELLGTLSFEPPPVIAEAWAELWKRWDDPTEQEKFRQLALAQNELVQAGRLYQLRLARLPGDPEAERGRGEVLRLVSTVAALSPSQRPDTRKIRRWTLGGAMLFITVMAAGLVGVLLAR